MRPSLIKAGIEDAGKTASSIAKEMGVAPVAVTNVINRKIRSRRIAEKIAEEIGKPFEKVFPEYLMQFSA
jgi:lambda repressor-like predicted transcriptional regulator